jgi:hypothetical protein
MSFGELADLMSAEAKVYRNGTLKNAILPTLEGKNITAGNIKKLLEPYVIKVLKKITAPETRELVETRFKTFQRNGLRRIRLNDHMHNFDKKGRIINQDAADALLVGYVNDAVAPLDLALYAENLQEKRAA